ncbi:MAG: lytic transglycosylase domain-containing protein [Actinobacteria bacterium]|nr:lytic transglycosylase domain-containing protein [Actinomycetota bacterium]
MTNRTRIHIAATVAIAVEAVVGWHLVSDDPDPDPDPFADRGECFPDDIDLGYEVGCRVTPPADMSEAIARAADEFDIDPWMVAVTVHRESGCDQYALGSAGEIGLAQVNPSVWMGTLRRNGIARRPQELYDVRTNLRASAYVLSRAHRAADGDLFGTFRRYNGSGPKARKYAREQVSAYASVALPDGAL